MKLKILTGALALLFTGSVLTGFSTQAAPSKAESDDHLAQEISEAVFRMDGATAQVSYDGGSTWDTSPTVELPDFYSYEEFAGWIETESDNLQALVAAGELTQEEAAAAIAQYQSALSGIEDGVQVGKRSSYEEDQIFFSMPNNPQSEVFQTVLYDGNSYRNFGRLRDPRRCHHEHAVSARPALPQAGGEDDRHGRRLQCASGCRNVDARPYCRSF